MSVFKEIGGNFWLKPEQLNLTKVEDPKLDFIRNQNNLLYTSSGRGAITLLLENINPFSRNVLLPAYTCDSVIRPFRNLDYKINYYDVDTDLTINEDILFKLINSCNPSIILFQSYFGMDTLRNVRPFFQQIRNRETIIIEDITHSWLSSFDKKGADFYICSLRKWLELPDGGVLISTTSDNMDRIIGAPQNLEIVRLFSEASLLKQEYSQTEKIELKHRYRELFYSAEGMLDEDYTPYSMSDISKNVLNNVDFNLISEIRRKNYNYLYSNLKVSNNLKFVFDDISEDVVPLYFPLYVDCKRDFMQKLLAENEIYAPVHWPISNEIIKKLNINVKYIYENILSIPCDQRYNEENMFRIVSTINTKIHDL